MPTYYNLIRAGYQPGADENPGTWPEVVTTDPRCLEPSEALDGTGVTETDLLTRTWDLAELSPLGPVDDEEGIECPDGWTVTSRTPDLSPVLGPQAAQILAAIKEAEITLTGWRDEADQARAAIENVYAAAVDEDYPQLEAARQAAVAALYQRGADGAWWNELGACQYGWEIVALAARDLTGTTPEWTPDAYDTLTRPWLTAFGRAVHPDDKTTNR
jgi:hypothetical protein